MGSSPSYEVQEDSLRQPVGRSKRSVHHGKDSVRSTKNKPINVEERPNPEQENQPVPPAPQQQPLLSQHEIHSQKDHPRILANAPQPNQQQIPEQEPLKKPSTEGVLCEQEEVEAQNAEESAEFAPREIHAHRENRKRHSGTEELEQEELEIHDRHKGRHYAKASTHQQPSEEALAINRSVVGRKGQQREIDYKQFDSMHIRHKAMQQLGQAEHHPHPIIAREPVYQHERLYTKILKNNHHEPKGHSETPGNRHYQHEHNIQEEAYEQPHKLNLYKRHIFRPHPNEHDAKELERSMEVRAHPDEEIRAILQPVRPKATGLDSQRREKGKSLPKNEEVPAQVNFRKRKASMPADIDQAQLRSHSKPQQLEEKSIADINKEKQFNVSQYQVDPAEMETCRAGCGRKFTADRIGKHEAVCKQVQQRRNVFNAQDHRIVTKQQRKLLKRSKGVENEKPKREVPKWKAQSIALRAHIKLGMDSHYAPTEEEEEMLSQEHHIDIVACPVCQRNFNKNAAKNHIPFCKAQLEKQLERERFEKPKTKR